MSVIHNPLNCNLGLQIFHLKDVGGQTTTLQVLCNLFLKARKNGHFLYKVVKTDDFLRVLPPFPFGKCLEDQSSENVLLTRDQSFLLSKMANSIL